MPISRSFVLLIVSAVVLVECGWRYEGFEGVRTSEWSGVTISNPAVYWGNGLLSAGASNPISGSVYYPPGHLSISGVASASPEMNGPYWGLGTVIKPDSISYWVAYSNSPANKLGAVTVSGSSRINDMIGGTVFTSSGLCTVSAEGTTLVSYVSSGTWYYVQLDFDWTNKKFNVIVDYSTVATSLSFLNSTATGISFLTFYNTASGTAHLDEIYLGCSNGCSRSGVYGAVRLSGPTSRNSTKMGLLETYYSYWGTVCDNSPFTYVGSTACKQLGYGTGTQCGSACFGQGTGSLNFMNVNCYSYTTYLASCSSYYGFGYSYCAHTQDVGVVCSDCGNGVLDMGELCEPALDSNCASDCSSCTPPYYYNSTLGVCVTDCGNGVLNSNEYCDYAIANSNCNSNCLSCYTYYFPNVSAPGTCIYTCGNGVLDYGEYCENNLSPYNCNYDCKSCYSGYVLNPNVNGTCWYACGNGMYDAGEQCDYSVDPTRCTSSCTCTTGYETNPLNMTTCRDKCGNGVWDSGEACDTAVDPVNCNAGCASCATGWSQNPNNKTTCQQTCGNGVLDSGESCDAAFFGCDQATCTCAANYSPNYYGGCIPTCGNGVLDSGEECDTGLRSSGCEGCRCTSGVADGCGRCAGEGDLRLMYYSSCSSSYGRVEIYHSSTWGTIYYYNFYSTQANVVCRQLGYSSYSTYNYYSYGSGPYDYPVWVQGSYGSCSSSYNRLDQCITAYTSSYADHYYDMGVSCYSSSCGNLRAEVGEECDGTTNCTSSCRCSVGTHSVPPGVCITDTCGDGVVDAGEFCDGTYCKADCTGCTGDSLFNATSSTCWRPCGNGIYEPQYNETCDTGIAFANCNSNCKSCITGHFPNNTAPGTCVMTCGNGRLDNGETCDTTVSPSTCNSDCLSCTSGYVANPNTPGACWISCGNGVHDAGETCDYVADPNYCTYECVCTYGYEQNPLDMATCRSKCGNGVYDSGEYCDFAVDPTHCTSSCTCNTGFEQDPSNQAVCRAICGNGNLDSGEACDAAYASCRSDCTCDPSLSSDGLGRCAQTCGNGVMDAGEECDDAFGSAGCVNCVCTSGVADTCGHCAAEGDVRLMYGGSCTTHYGYGRLEVLYSGIWGTICNTYFSYNHANAACRDLGFTSYSSYSAYSWTGSGTIWVYYLYSTCGSSSSFDTCVNGFGTYTSYCSHSQDIGLYCSKSCGDGVVNIGEECDSSAHCTSSCACAPGYHKAFSDFCLSDLCGNGIFDSGEVCDDEMSTGCTYCGCDYGYVPVGDGTCRALVDGELRLQNGNSTSGRVEIWHSNAWGTVCNSGWDDADATIACRDIGYPAGLAVNNLAYGAGSGSVWISDVQCAGNETSFSQCPFTAWGVSCSHSSDAGVDCLLSNCNLTCSGNGNCYDGTCRCLKGYFGNDCESKLCPGNCTTHGTCNYGTGVCACNDGYSMADCSCFNTTLAANTAVSGTLAAYEWRYFQFTAPSSLIGGFDIEVRAASSAVNLFATVFTGQQQCPASTGAFSRADTSSTYFAGYEGNQYLTYLNVTACNNATGVWLIAVRETAGVATAFTVQVITSRATLASGQAISSIADTTDTYYHAISVPSGKNALIIDVVAATSQATLSVEVHYDGCSGRYYTATMLSAGRYQLIWDVNLALFYSGNYYISVTTSVYTAYTITASLSTCSRTCFNAAPCINDVCMCKDRWTGPSCNELDCPNNCTAHGSCDRSTGVCGCDSSYSESDCSCYSSTLTANTDVAGSVLGNNWSFYEYTHDSTTYPGGFDVFVTAAPSVFVYVGFGFSSKCPAGTYGWIDSGATSATVAKAIATVSACQRFTSPKWTIAVQDQSGSAQPYTLRISTTRANLVNGEGVSGVASSNAEDAQHAIVVASGARSLYVVVHPVTTGLTWTLTVKKSGCPTASPDFTITSADLASGDYVKLIASPSPAIYYFSVKTNNAAGSYILTAFASNCENQCNNGLCVNSQCKCFAGFTGATCLDRTCPNNCMGKGTCDSQTGMCQCPADASAFDCSCPVNGTLSNSASGSQISKQWIRYKVRAEEYPAGFTATLTSSAQHSLVIDFDDCISNPAAAFMYATASASSRATKTVDVCSMAKSRNWLVGLYTVLNITSYTVELAQNTDQLLVGDNKVIDVVIPPKSSATNAKFFAASVQQSGKPFTVRVKDNNFNPSDNNHAGVVVKVWDHDCPTLLGPSLAQVSVTDAGYNSGSYSLDIPSIPTGVYYIGIFSNSTSQRAVSINVKFGETAKSSAGVVRPAILPIILACLFMALARRFWN